MFKFEDDVWTFEDITLESDGQLLDSNYVAIEKMIKRCINNETKPYPVGSKNVNSQV